MPNERNNETQQALKREIKSLQVQCAQTCNIIENAPPEGFLAQDNVNEKALAYVEGLRTDIQNSNTPIITDSNLLTTQFLNDVTEKLVQVEELSAYTRGCIHDVDTEINRLENLIKVAEEAKSRPRARKQEIRPEHIQKAKERFHMMKNELHGLINSLFPGNSEAMTDVLGQLMAERLNEESSGYIPITSEIYKLIELLKDMNIVVANPYNNMEVKLAY